MDKNKSLEIEKHKLGSRKSAITDLDSECIQNQIYTIRGVQVMMDRDLAKLYEVETRVLKQSVRRNIDYFPDDFMFILSANEANDLIFSGVSQSVIPSGYNTGGASMYVFTEQGIAMLASILKSERAKKASIMIMRAFVAMRRFLTANAGIFQRLEQVERHQVETDCKIDLVLDSLESGSLKEKAHIFSAGQIYDAKAFITELISKAKREVVLVDGYVSSVTIDLLDARIEGVPCTIYTGSVGPTFTTLLENHRAQFPHKPLDIKKWRILQHDRWLIIDDELWHCGASIKDAGVKTFGIDLIGLNASIILNDVL